MVLQNTCKDELVDFIPNICLCLNTRNEMVADGLLAFSFGALKAEIVSLLLLLFPTYLASFLNSTNFLLPKRSVEFYIDEKSLYMTKIKLA